VIGDADRRSRLVVDEGDLRLAHQHGLAVLQFVFQLDGAADDLLGRDATLAWHFLARTMSIWPSREGVRFTYRSAFNA